MSDTEAPRSTDSHWKIALEGYFQQFLALLFPAVRARVDWERSYSFLDKELKQIRVDVG